MHYQEILDFWFDPQTMEKWFIKSPAFDQEIRDRFLETYDKARAGDYDHWRQDIKGALALVILFDQFPRNMFRDMRQAFETDDLALHIATEAIQTFGLDDLEIMEQVTLAMPYMHSESLEIQAQSVALFEKIGREKNIKYAKSHYEVVERFGRFPFRNQALDRPSTPQEKAYMAENENF